MFNEFHSRLSHLESEERYFQRGEPIFLKGEKPEGLIIVEDGTQLEIQTEGDYGGWGGVQRRIWGLREVVTESHFSHSLYASESISCLFVSRNCILDETRNDPHFRIQVMQVLAHLLRETGEGFE